MDQNLNPALKHGPIYYIRAAFWIVLVLALGFLLINQGLKFFYGAHLLKAPCDLCAELNPGIQDCFEYMNQPRASYWMGDEEGWSDPFGYPVKINITYIP